MGSREHSFLKAEPSLSERQSARQLAEESRAALVGLESTLNRRNQVLEQQVKDQQQEIVCVSREKEKVEQKLEDELRDFAHKREEFWLTIRTSQEDLGRAHDNMEQLKRRLSEQERTREEEQRRADQLVQQLQNQRQYFADIRSTLTEEVRTGNVQQEQLQQSVQRLEKQLKDQRTAFEQERARWQQGTTTGGQNVQAGLRSSLEVVMPHLRSLLEAFDREKAGGGVDSQPVGGNQAQPTETIDLTLADDATPRSSEQEREQSNDAASIQRDISLRNLSEREGVLTCPISLELFVDPVVTRCCGKTFSSDGLRQALRRSLVCPFCRASGVSYYSNRDMAKLVDLHRAERSILELPELSPPSPSPRSPVSARGADNETASSLNRSRFSSPDSGRQSRYREHRSERAHVRSYFFRRQPSSSRSSSTTAAPTGTTRDSQLPGSSFSSSRNAQNASSPIREPFERRAWVSDEDSIIPSAISSSAAPVITPWSRPLARPVFGEGDLGQHLATAIRTHQAFQDSVRSRVRRAFYHGLGSTATETEDQPSARRRDSITSRGEHRNHDLQDSDSRSYSSSDSY